jgi:hypothetical protein
VSASNPKPDQPKPALEHAKPLAPLEGEFYFEGPYMVFTEEYHLRRGYCCHSDCRHCPYSSNS